MHLQPLLRLARVGFAAGQETLCGSPPRRHPPRVVNLHQRRRAGPAARSAVGGLGWHGEQQQRRQPLPLQPGTPSCMSLLLPTSCPYHALKVQTPVLCLPTTTHISVHGAQQQKVVGNDLGQQRRAVDVAQQRRASKHIVTWQRRAGWWWWWWCGGEGVVCVCVWGGVVGVWVCVVVGVCVGGVCVCVWGGGGGGGGGRRGRYSASTARAQQKKEGPRGRRMLWP